MASVNKVMLLGRLTADPELRYTPKGTAVCDLRMALNRTYTDANGEKKEETVFVDVTAWQRTAELCAQYMKKGRQLFVEGRLKFDQWEQEGQKRSKLSVTADQVTFVDSGGGRELSSEGSEGGGARRGGYQRGAPSPGRAPQRPNAPPPESDEPPPPPADDQPPPHMEGDPPF